MANFLTLRFCKIDIGYTSAMMKHGIRISETYIQQMNTRIYLQIRGLLLEFEQAEQLDRRIAGYGISAVTGLMTGLVIYGYYNPLKALVF